MIHQMTYNRYDLSHRMNVKQFIHGFTFNETMNFES